MSFVGIMFGMCAFCGIVGVIAAIRNEKRYDREFKRITKESRLKHDHI